MINSGITNDTNVGIIQFALNVTYKYNFSQIQLPRTSLLNKVNSLVYDAGRGTYMKDAITYGISQFNSPSARNVANTTRLLFLVTDGVPSPGSEQDPCSLKAQADLKNITIIVIGVGNGFSPTAITCLVNSASTQIIKVATFSSSSFASIRNATDSFTCPSNVNIKITEVRPIGNSTGRGKFVELYNKGSSLDMLANPINLTGIVTAYITNNTLKKWDNYTYLILFDGLNSKELPNCRNCTNCIDVDSNELNGRQCNKAYYINCTGITNKGGCFFSSTYKGSAISKTNWGVIAYDNTDSSVASNVSYSNSFPGIYDYYSYELTNINYDISDGNNWRQSCTPDGTPGSIPITTCIYGCTVDNCRSGGDTGATCLNPDTCLCSSTSYYYSNGVCKPINPPSYCSTLIFKT